MFIRSGYSAHTRSVSSGMERHHHTRDVLVSGRDLHPSRRLKPSIRALAFQRLGRDAVKRHLVELDGQLTADADRLAPSLQHEALFAPADRGRATAVDDPGAVADLGWG